MQPCPLSLCASTRQGERASTSHTALLSTKLLLGTLAGSLTLRKLKNPSDCRHHHASCGTTSSSISHWVSLVSPDFLFRCSRCGYTGLCLDFSLPYKRAEGCVVGCFGWARWAYKGRRGEKERLIFPISRFIFFISEEDEGLFVAELRMKE